MLSKEELNIVEQFQYFDKYGKLPNKKIRLNIVLSRKVIGKLVNKNKSKTIESLILKYL